MLASVSDSRRISIWPLNLGNSQPIYSFESGVKQISALAFTTDSTHLIVVSDAGDIHVWEFDPPRLTQSTTLPEAFPSETFLKTIAVAVASKANRLFIGTGFISADMLNEWALDNRQLISHSHFRDKFEKLAVTPDADHMLCALTEIRGVGPERKWLSTFAYTSGARVYRQRAGNYS